MKSLAHFINDNIDLIINEWENFAGSLPPAPFMTRSALRGHLIDILIVIAQQIKSVPKGNDTETNAGNEIVLPDTAAEIHGALRLENGFDVMQMVSEYQALRKSVARLWVKQHHETDVSAIMDLIRFNEAIDMSLMESITRFTKNLDESKNLFLGILGHDLRNPLGAIIMSAHLLKRKGVLNQTQAFLASQIEDSATRINDMTTDLLDVTRAKLGSGIPVERKEMNFFNVTRKIVEEMRASHPARQLILNIEGSMQGRGDPARIEQVLSNLLGNALQYGSTEFPITVSLSGKEDAICLSVHNKGKPIPESALPTLFESLVRGPEGTAEQRRGSTNLGLGLYIARMITLAHGGDLSVSSTQKEGTTFTACFPQ